MAFSGEGQQFTKVIGQLNTCVMKVDHFKGIDILPPKFEGAPNWRQMGDLLVFGSAQPTLEGIRNVLAHYKGNSVSKLLWINMRTEPVVYVQNKSFAPRLKENPKVRAKFLTLTEDRRNVQAFLFHIFIACYGAFYDHYCKLCNTVFFEFFFLGGGGGGL